VVELTNEKFQHYPEMFQRWPKSREMLLKFVGNNTSIFFNYPKLTNAMNRGVEMGKIPIELQNIAEEFDDDFST
jgi:hypothetical protein